MKNYYEILEVNETASKETIEKVYKLLVKKYHPDLQPDETKKQGEEKIKELSEAYEILSDDTKKREYDVRLKEFKIQQIAQEIKDQYINNTEKTEVAVETVGKESQGNQNQFSISDDEIRRQAQVYYDEMYRQYLYRNGYIKDYPALIKHYITVALTILVLCIVFVLLYHIPFLNKIFWDFMEQNPLLKEIVRIVFGMTN